MSSEETINLSIILPAYNEEENLPIVLKEITTALESANECYEVLVINDGSTDGTGRVLQGLQSEYDFLRVIEMKKNYGQSAAFMAGFREARGDRFVTLDSDLQNDPADIPKILKYLNDYDLVNGWRKDRHDTWVRKVSSKIANGVRNFISGENIRDTSCSLKAYRRSAVERIKMFDGMHRFLPTLVKLEGGRVIEIPVNHRDRTLGESKYNIRNRVFRSFIDLLAVRWMKHRTRLPEYELLPGKSREG